MIHCARMSSLITLPTHYALISKEYQNSVISLISFTTDENNQENFYYLQVKFTNASSIDQSVIQLFNLICSLL